MNSLCNHLQFENTINISFFLSQRQPIGGPPSDTWPYTYPVPEGEEMVITHGFK